MHTGVLQGSILGHLLFLIYITDFHEGISLTAKLLANDKSIFPVVKGMNVSAENTISRKKIAKTSNCVIKKLNNILPGNPSLTIYKSFVRPHLDYGDILYHHSNNNKSMNSKLKLLTWSLLEP